MAHEEPGNDAAPWRAPGQGDGAGDFTPAVAPAAGSDGFYGGRAPGDDPFSYGPAPAPAPMPAPWQSPAKPREGVSAGAIVAFAVAGALVLAAVSVAIIVGLASQPDSTDLGGDSAVTWTASAEPGFDEPDSDGAQEEDEPGTGDDDSAGGSAGSAVPGDPARKLNAPVKVGDCLTSLPEAYSDGAATRLATAKVVACTTPHEGEVIDLTEASPADDPGSERRYAASWCYQQSDAAVDLWGLPFRLQGTAFHAPDDQWKAGNRWVACVGQIRSEGMAAPATPLKQYGAGGKATLVPRGTLYYAKQGLKAGQCTKYGGSGELPSPDSAIDCAQPHSLQLLGYDTITATTVADAAKEAATKCGAFFDRLPLSQAQRAGLRAVPYYNDPAISDTSLLACAIAPWSGGKSLGDATKGASWPPLQEDDF